MEHRPPKNRICAFLMAVMTFAVVAGLPNAQTLAVDGFSSVSLLVIGAIVTLTPAALIAGELGTSFIAEGGIYAWVSAAFGPRAGFVCIFLQWAVQILLLVTVLAYLASTLGLAFGSASFGAENIVIMAVIVVVAVVATLLNFLGLRDVGVLGTVAMTIATIIPAATILGFGIAAVATGHSQIPLGLSHLMPETQNTTAWASIGGAIAAFTGVEVSAAFIPHLKRPVRDYLLGIAGASIVCIVLMVSVTLVIAMSLPANQINIVQGLPDTIRTLTAHFGVGWLGTLVLLGIVIGFTMRQTNVLLGPATALVATAKDGHLPRSLGKLTPRGVPKTLLLVQMAIILGIGLIFAFTPVQQAFWILVIVATNLYMVVYTVMFLAALRLRYKDPDRKRPFRVGPNWVMWVVAVGGSLINVAIIVTGLLPRPLEGGTSLGTFYVLSIAATLVLLAAPIVVDVFSRRSNRRHDARLEVADVDKIAGELVDVA